MTELLTADQMRRFEQSEIAGGKVTGRELMARAGKGVVSAMLEKWPELAAKSQTVCVLCGPGNNGGDGFVIALLLKKLRWDVQVYLLGEGQKLPPDARHYFDNWTKDNPVQALTAKAVSSGPRPDVMIDAVFGLGLKRPLEDDVLRALCAGQHKMWPRIYDIKRVAVDAPSGLDLDTGGIALDFPEETEAELANPWPGMVNNADLTVTFHAPKVGHCLGLGPTVCGVLKVVDIGLSGAAVERGMLGMTPAPDQVRLVEPLSMGRPLPVRVWPLSVMGKGSVSGHKYTHGHVICFAGGVGRGGAGRLAARAALRAGAGLVTVVCPPAALIENACQLEAVMLRALKKDQPLGEVADARVSAFVVGPGMGLGARTKERVAEVLNRRAEGSAWRDPAVVLDADALSSFADDPQALFDVTHARTILTPHEGEFARLFPDLVGPARRHLSKVDAVRQAAKRAGCIILLKGVDTVIASPEGGASVHVAAYGREAPWLATAGAGDVLAGLIAGLAAPATAGDLFALAEIATYLHVEAARRFGPGLIAEDLPDVLPAVFAKLEG